MKVSVGKVEGKSIIIRCPQGQLDFHLRTTIVFMPHRYDFDRLGFISAASSSDINDIAFEFSVSAREIKRALLFGD
ncbi:hypothetical protein D3C81_1069960 [compost metagenome]